MLPVILTESKRRKPTRPKVSRLMPSRCLQI